MHKPPIICADRDGTINEDDNYYLGVSKDWKKQVALMPRVVEGIQRINRLPLSHFFIVTNQAGVALSNPEFADLTEERMREVNKYIISLLQQRGCRIDGCFACPFVDSAYADKSKIRGRSVNPDYIRENHPDMKPNIGMLEKSAQACGYLLPECEVYVIGDRMGDIELALNGGGRGILVASPKTRELGDFEKVHYLAGKHPERVYIADDFDCAASIVERIRVQS